MSVSNILTKFGKRVVKEGRTALTKKRKNASKELYDSLNYTLKETKNTFELSINMLPYGKFVDQGVTGKNDSSFSGERKTVNQSLGGFRFGTGNFNGKGGEWKKRIDNWMYTRGIAPRDKKTGKFIKRDTVNYLIRRSIFQHGLKPTLFLTKPFESAYKNLPDELLAGYGLEIDKFLTDLKI